MTRQPGQCKPKLWVPGDWNAFFGLGTNVLLNVLVLSGLVLFVIQVPGRDRLRPDPAGARHRPAARQPVVRLPGLPAGPEGGPRRRRGDAVRAERAALLLRDLRDHAAGRPDDGGDAVEACRRAWPGRSSSASMVLIGAFVGPTIRKYTPRAAMLGTLAGISIAFIACAGVPDVRGAVDRARRRSRSSCCRGPPACACRSGSPAAWRRSSSAPSSAGRRTCRVRLDRARPDGRRRLVRPVRHPPAAASGPRS